MRLIICERQNMVSDMNVASGIVLIGSHPTCDIYLPDGRLAPRHLIIEPEGDAGWTVRPLDTSTPATVNKMLLQSRHRLKTGDEIGFADYGIRVYLDDQSPAAATSVQAVNRMDETLIPSRWPIPADSVLLRPSDTVNLEAAGLLLLAQLTPKLYQADTAQELLDMLAGWLLPVFKADRAWVCLATDPEHDPHMCASADAAGHPVKAPEKTGLLIHRAVQRQQSLLMPADPTRYASAMLAPLAAGNTCLGLLYLERAPGSKSGFPRPDLATLRVIGCQAGTRLDELLRGHQQTVREKAQLQLDWAHQVQERLTPAQLPAWDNMELAAYRQAGQACCGDVFDVVRLPKGTAAVLLGHAMAGGAEAAVLMATVRAALRVALLHADAPHFVLKELNWLVQDAAAQVAMRCFAGLLDPASGKMRFSAAGLPGAYLVAPTGHTSNLVPKEIPELGTQPQIEYPAYEATIAPEDSLVLFTRGLVTALSEKGEPFGLDRIVTNLEDAASQTTHLMLQALVDDLSAHLGKNKPHEDVTVLILRRLT